jgi:3-oxoadipate CoA-transferase alpha subunit
VLEAAIRADFSLVKCAAADKYGNLIYNKTARNFGPVMCTAAKTTIVQAKQILELGEINPEHVITPGIFVHRVVEITHPADESKLVADKVRYHGIKS